MQLFFFLLFLNLLLGAVPDFLPKGPKNSYGLFSFARGVISASTAVLFFNTQFAYLFAFTGCVAGLILAPWHKKDREDSLVGTSWGFLAAAIPTTAAAMALFFIVGYGISNNKIVSITWTFFLLPFITALVARHDIYIILAVLMSLVVIYHLLPSLEAATQRQPNSLLKKRVVFVKGLSLLVLLSFMTILFFTRHVYRGFGMQVDIIRQGNPDFPLIALTFDDGPDPLYTPAILDILQEYQVPATFFLV
ncbi:MAG TPA: polysaccharide deacetylase family protein, partial [Firmicutes bacterium]|nr:polysaccharide deacetylase family protein [Bacillota bacterium]